MASSSPPTCTVGFRPFSHITCAIIAVTVVLPCVPLTPMGQTCSRQSSPSSSARSIWGIPSSRAAARSGLSGAMAAEYTTRFAWRTRSASCPICTGMPACTSASVLCEAVRSEPVTSIPSCCISRASPLIEQPPAPMKCTRLPTKFFRSMPTCTAPSMPIRYYTLCNVKLSRGIAWKSGAVVLKMQFAGGFYPGEMEKPTYYAV